MDATYTGTLTWGNHSRPAEDDDYSIYLATDNNVGQTVNNGAGGIEIEFDSSETIDHFYTRWWNDFHSIVDNPTPRRNAAGLLQGRFAIVTGLLGLDHEHNSGQTELHPVYAIAIRTRELYLDPSWPFADEESWAFFVRNWGNEGWCSSGNETTPHTQFTFRLPWPKRTASASIKNATVLNRGPQQTGGPTWTFESRPDLHASLLKVTVRNAGHGDLVHGELDLILQPEPQPGQAGRRQPSASDLLRIRSQAAREMAAQHPGAWKRYLAERGEKGRRPGAHGEERIHQLMQVATEAQLAELARLLPRTELSRDTTITRRVARMPPPEAVPRREPATTPYPEFDARMMRNREVLRRVFGSEID